MPKKYTLKVGRHYFEGKTKTDAAKRLEESLDTLTAFAHRSATSFKVLHSAGHVRIIKAYEGGGFEVVSFECDTTGVAKCSTMLAALGDTLEQLVASSAYDLAQRSWNGSIRDVPAILSLCTPIQVDEFDRWTAWQLAYTFSRNENPNATDVQLRQLADSRHNAYLQQRKEAIGISNLKPLPILGNAVG